MTQTKDEAKLEKVKSAIRRWQSKAKYAMTKLDKLAKQQRHLEKKLSASKPKPRSVPLASSEVESVATNVAAGSPDCVPVTSDYDAVEKAAAELVTKKDKDIPSFLDRSDPLIAERMTAARKKAEEADRHKMPLTGRAAEAYLKQSQKKKRRKEAASAAVDRGV